MRNFKYANLRYCSLLERNVVFESYYDECGEKNCECIYKSLCSYDKYGCRNRLFAPSAAAVGADMQGSELCPPQQSLAN